MTPITIDRAIVEQALEALEMSRRFVYADNRPQCDDAITALRAALAQQDEPKGGGNLPPPWRCPQCNGPADNGHDRSIPPNPYLCTKCMAEPTQEPDHTYKLIGCVQHDCEECQRRTQREPLAEEEIYKIYNEFWRSTEAVDFARAIERAHGIKERK